MSGVVDSLEEIKMYLCSGNPVWDVSEVAAVMNEAIEAVEKRTAKKPVRGYMYGKLMRKGLIARGKQTLADAKSDCCPSCGEWLGVVVYGCGYPYCHKCGQKIDWEGREENGFDG